MDSRFPIRERLDGPAVAALIQGGAGRVEANRQRIDQLNVFPVPDGDTGTNLSLTLRACAEAIPGGEVRAGKVTMAAAKGALLGARGNSGVIFSQLFRGWAKALEDKDTVTPLDWARAMEKGVEMAYKAVMKPVEGTILTVARAAAKEALAAARPGSDLDRILTAAVTAAQRALDKTPDQLSLLKEAGVVDAGGQGYVFFLEGCLQALRGESGEPIDSDAMTPVPEAVPAEATAPGGPSSEREPAEAAPERFCYCTEFILKGRQLPLDGLRKRLVDMGDCLLVVGDPDAAKIHIHTDHPGLVLEQALQCGTLHDIHINNMVEQAKARAAVISGEAVKDEGTRTPVAVIAAAPSAGWARLFQEQGAVAVVDGGTSRNPSANDWLAALEKASADFCLLLPNHPNLIMAARQAVQIYGEDRAAVVATRHLPGGLAAMLAFDPGKDVRDLQAGMEKAGRDIRCLEITRAVRDATVNGVAVREGDLIGLLDDSLIAGGVELSGVVREALTVAGGRWELVTLYQGEAVDPSEVERLIEVIEAACPDAEVEAVTTGQPLYPYIIGLE
ncbi:DAK2 domain-containing protein [Heliobacterium gestii]|uniref:DAK2 domain-containing protein n=1 Tax=Heliomicrobium gestii TaxID=2699 RepID=A0A845LG49_HELGE|nr:DAK2 domain-containing protein [Heliomicrobium gestii]MBM7867026.1 DAK2 domain fusion protein YloV [Heliomicrobium gestii]MZP43559.1 DAK2 domain-containing protein [Heliomicrobium gestii]